MHLAEIETYNGVLTEIPFSMVDPVVQYNSTWI